ncbi:DNA internalization-related competence protein ComEC/Rec2 [uncultured Pseudoteredinibacter sp.]|uniref:DNA internalization-related competence protein ComEC/Rec2 n=1 Tax=uncultured Pseudoteredinibacter sp. TaxID=1641701 RepID=UPI0026157D0C|nr:DNA internalization-related competence protein ComEC/Rec2 [uncultured Pseudoteredinibacter sp.]
MRALLFLIAMVLAGQLSLMPPRMVLYGGGLLALLLFVASWYCSDDQPKGRKKNKHWLSQHLSISYLLNLTACFLLGACLILVRADFQMQKQWPALLEGRSLVAEFEIISQPEIGQRSYRFQARLSELAFANGQPLDSAFWQRQKQHKLNLSLYYTTALKLDPEYKQQSPQRLQSQIGLFTGAIVKAEVKLKRPRGLHNFGASDYQARMLSQRIVAQGYIKKLHAIEPRDYSSLRMRLAQYLDDQAIQHGAYLKGLLLGDRSDLDKEDWALLQQTGTGHLLAISGLHIGLSAGIGLLLFSAIGRIAQLFSERMPAAQMLAMWGSGFTALAYAYLADFSLPTQRALIMLWVYLLAALSARQVSSWQVLIVALIALLLLDPWSLEQAGGCLSFAAVAALVYGYWGRSNKFGLAKKAKPTISRSLMDKLKHYIWQLLRAQIIIMSFLTTVLFSLQLPSGSLSMPANLLAIPWLSFVVMPLLMLFCIQWLLGLDWHWPLQWADKAMDVLLFYLQQLLYWKSETLSKYDIELETLWWPSIAFSSTTFFLMLLSGLLFWLPKGFHGRLLFLIPLIILCTTSTREQSKDLTITTLDVGQGLAVLIEKGSRVVLYDTGPIFGQEYNAGASIIAPFLRYRGIKTIDHLVVSHGDLDHAGGVNSIAQQFNLEEVWTEGNYQNTLQHSEFISKPVKSCQAGESWYWQGIKFTWLWPNAKKHKASAAKRRNNRSCVLLLRYQNLKVLLPGDIESWAEKQILKELNGQAQEGLTAKQNRANICQLNAMLLPHHGSHSSSHKAWAKCTQPAVTISSSGWQNHFGHPSPKVLRRYPNSIQLDTGRDGAISLSYGQDENGLIRLQSISRSRDLRRRYWHD